MVKNILSRIENKHDTEANWNQAYDFVPKAGEIIVYDKDDNYHYERIKIGDGITPISKLSFIAAQPDWNQNDSNSPDYVKNRTHWEELTTIILADNLTIESISNGTESIGKLQLNKLYDVIFDGELYPQMECTGYIEGENGFISLGFGEYPFGIDQYQYDGEITNEAFFSTDNPASTITIKTTDIIVHPIDHKYLPDCATKEEVENKMSLDKALINVSSHWPTRALCNSNKLVISDADFYAYSSEDAINWVKVPFSQTPCGPLQDRLYVDSKFIFLFKNIICYSTDGINWQTVPNPLREENTINGFKICYLNNKFFIRNMGNGYQYLASSNDLINWDIATLPSVRWENLPVYVNDKFIMFSTSKCIGVYSNDGVSWTEITLPDSVGAWNNPIYVENKFVTSSHSRALNYIIYSVDGINWSTADLPINTNWNPIIYEAGKFILLPSVTTDALLYSIDGVEWIQSTLPKKAQWTVPIYIHDKFISFTKNDSFSMYSEDGVNWVLIDLPICVKYLSNGNNILTLDEKVFVISYGDIMYSNDGINWHKSIVPETCSEQDNIMRLNDRLVATDMFGHVSYSLDGITWIDTYDYLKQNDTDITDSVKTALGVDVDIETAIRLATKTGLVNPTVNEYGAIYTDENGLLYIL